MNSKYTVSRILIVSAFIGAVIGLIAAICFASDVLFLGEFLLPPGCILWLLPALIGGAIGVLVGGIVEIIITKRSRRDSS